MPDSSELIMQEIEKYGMLQRIKAASSEENPVLDYEIQLSEAKPESLGIILVILVTLNNCRRQLFSVTAYTAVRNTNGS